MNQEIVEYIFTALGLCAKLPVLVKDSKQKLENMINANGNGYQGAKLDNLTFDIVQNNDETEFIYKNLDKIID